MANGVLGGLTECQSVLHEGSNPHCDARTGQGGGSVGVLGLGRGPQGDGKLSHTKRQSADTAITGVSADCAIT